MRDFPNILQWLFCFLTSLFLKRNGIIVGLFLLVPLLLNGQKTTKPSSVLLTILAENISEGDLIAFRDLAKLYDKYPENQEVIGLLKQHTLFTDLEWDWNVKGKNNLLTHFFYENEALFQFSELLETFYLTPIEGRTSKVEIEPIASLQIDPFLIRKSVQKINSHLRKKEIDLLRKEIEHIGLLRNATVFNILSKFLERKTDLRESQDD